MKKPILYLIACFFLIVGCEENMPVIPPVGPQDSGNRVVLIEEFTGVRCVNCPEGSAELENLLALNPNNLVVVSIHASGSFAIPLPDSKYDFRTEEGEQILSLLGEPLGYPSAVVNRKKFGDATYQKGKNEWGALVAEELQQEPVANLNLEANYSPNERALSVDLTILPLQDMQGDHRVTVMILENGIIDYQDTLEGKVADYKHKHVMRKTLTNPTGSSISDDNLLEGQPFEKSFSYILPNEWVDENCSVIAFIHLGGQNKDVLQAVGVDITE